MPAWLLVLGLALPAHAANHVTVGPYLQDVTPSGFLVAFETAEEAHAAVEVGLQRVSTHGKRHEARVAGLKPGTRYKYRLFVDDQQVGGGDAETAPAPETQPAFTFLVYGDTREGGDIERKLSQLMLAEGADLALHTGDIARQGDDEVSWANYFQTEAALLASLPVYPAVGNHELYQDPAADHFRRFFVLPDEGRARHYYHFRWGKSVDFIALDGNANIAEQTAWLDAEIRRAETEGIRHVFVWLHQPPFSTGGHCGSAVVEQHWVELFERHPIIRAVFGGHDHAYERLERNGVRYFVSGGGGTKVYPEATGCPSFDYAARKLYAAEHHYLRVKVAGDEVEVTAVRADGPPIEVVRWKRGDKLVSETSSDDPPPLVDDRLFGKLPKSYVLYAAGFGLFLIAGSFLRRRRRS
jgi:acid phosphatase type 7